MKTNYLKSTVKYKTLLAISRDLKCTYKGMQTKVLIVSGKDPIKEYSRGYYCTNICDWKYSNLITKKGKFYRLTSLGKLYLKNPQKANDKIRIDSLSASRDWWRNKANELYSERINKTNLENSLSTKELKELREENYNLSYKLNEIRKALELLKNI